MPPENYSGTAEFTSPAANVGHKVDEAIDHARNAAADGIASAAGSLHSRANDIPGGAARAASFAHGTADRLNSAADYIRGHDMGSMLEDVKTLAKKNPVPVLLGAAAIGFLLAKAFSRD